MKRHLDVCGACAAATILLSGCAIDFDRLVATVASDYAPAQRCDATKGVGAHFLPAISSLSAGFDAKYAELPAPLQNDRFINSVFLQAKYLSVNSVRIAQQYHGLMSAGDFSIATSVPRPSVITQTDIANFARLASEYVLRETGSPLNDAVRNPYASFWERLQAYYEAYYTGKFVTYFGRTFNQPRNSLTITDNDIVQGMTVLLELIFDGLDRMNDIPVWSHQEPLPGGKTQLIYYPGGTEKIPTAVSLKYREVISLDIKRQGCVMTVAKAKTIAHLANTFATAASMDTGLTIKSIGGLHVGLGVAGKLSIGDNSTLTMLAQAAVSEVVTRLTVELTYPILKALDFPTAVATARKAGASRDSALIHEMSAPFVSPNVYR